MLNQTSWFKENKKKIWEEAKNVLISYLFMAPALVGILIFVVMPTFLGVYYSFTDYDIVNSPRLIGLANYRELFRDPIFRVALINVIKFVIILVPAQTIAGLSLALLVNQKIKMKSLFSSVYFIPVVSSMIVAAVLWKFIFDPMQGPLNRILALLGVEGPLWLFSPDWALPAICIMMIWQSAAYYMVIFWAGLQNIPAQLEEAAKVDGANRWRIFWRITLPLLLPTTVFVIILNLISVFRIFDQVWVMTFGGPGYSTMTVVMYLYQAAFRRLSMGYGASIGCVLFVIIFVVTLFSIVIMRKGFESYY